MAPAVAVFGAFQRTEKKIGNDHYQATVRSARVISKDVCQGPLTANHVLDQHGQDSSLAKAAAASGSS